MAIQQELKIGVDARSLSRSITGIGRYTLEMCKALNKIPGVSLYIYSPCPIPEDILNQIKPAHYKHRQIYGLVSRQLWVDSFLPWWARQDQVDVLWGPSHRLPTIMFSQTPKIVTIHDMVWKYAGHTMRRATRALERFHMPRAIKKADHIVADSTATLEAIKGNFHVGEDKISHIYLGADHVEAKPDASLLKAYELSDYCLFVGTLEPRKNLGALLKAYSMLPLHVKEGCNLVIAGGKGWGDMNLANTIKDLGLEPYIKLLGYVDEPTLAALYAKARFLAMPSIYEGFGLPLVEAMMYGTPVLTANNSSMIEVAGQGGVLVDAHDVNSIALGLNQLITDNGLHAKLSSNAKKHVKNFTWERAAENMMAVFRGVVEKKRGAA